MDDKLNQTTLSPVGIEAAADRRIELVPIALRPEEQAKLSALEHRLAELTADMGELVQVFGKESERSPAHGVVTGCLECLLMDRLRPAGEALAALHDLVADNFRG